MNMLNFLKLELSPLPLQNMNWLYLAALNGEKLTFLSQ